MLVPWWVLVQYLHLHVCLSWPLFGWDQESGHELNHLVHSLSYSSIFDVQSVFVVFGGDVGSTCYHLNKKDKEYLKYHILYMMYSIYIVMNTYSYIQYILTLWTLITCRVSRTMVNSSPFAGRFAGQMSWADAPSLSGNEVAARGSRFLVSVKSSKNSLSL